MNRYAAVFTDAHGNREALAAVLGAVDAEGLGPVYCLGDIVGYGPDPSWCVQEVRRRGCTCVLGNHDAVAAGLRTADDFNPPALKAMKWTQAQLSDDERAFLTSLPTRRQVQTPSGMAIVVHGNLVDDFVSYITSPETAQLSLAYLHPGSYALFGHTHRPLAWTMTGEVVVRHAVVTDEWFAIPRVPTLLNPGSVGQPRDKDNRASFLVWDREGRRCMWRRVEYAIADTQAKMRAAGLPEFLVTRLDAGH